MEKVIKILEKIRKKNPQAYPVSRYDIIKSRTLNDYIKEIYIEKMLEHVSVNKKDELIVSNKNLKKEIKQNNHFFSSATLLLMTCVGTMLLLIMSSIFFANNSLGKTLLNTSFVLFISFLVPLFLIKKGVDKNTKNIENRVLEINDEISQQEYRDIVIKATHSIVEDIEKIDCNPVEKKRLKNHILRLQSYYEQECEKVFYQKLAFVEKDIKNKMIIKKDLNNELLKVKIPTYMK